jgi:ABC-2 type transport system ATP-binding protein
METDEAKGLSKSYDSLSNVNDINFAIEVKNLKRIFTKAKEKPFIAVDSISFKVRWGEIFGLLGPNGAGKTTIIKIMSTLLYPTEGTVLVNGFDVTKHPREIRERINLVSGGESGGYGILTVGESLWMFSQFYGIPTKIANERIEKYLRIVDIWENRNTLINRLSTGMMQKINLVRGLVTEPKILFLDEPTLGLDVEAAIVIRNIVKDWVKVKDERAVLLTTHYMAEADELCDNIAIINKGKLVACDSPKKLKESIYKDIYFQIEIETLLSNSINKLERLKASGIDFSVKHVPEENSSILNLSLKSEKDITKVISLLEEMNLEVKYLKKSEPTLEDVFLKLVGKRFEDEEVHD